MKHSAACLNQQSPEGGEKNCLNSQLWHACAGPLVSLPSLGSHVVYFPQGHSEQVTMSTNKEVDAQMPNYQSLPAQLVCQLHNVTMHADIKTDEVYAQMTLQPLSAQEQKEVSFLPADLGAASKQPTNYFCKTLTASDTSTHGGFSVPRRAAEKVFPPLGPIQPDFEQCGFYVLQFMKEIVDRLIKEDSISFGSQFKKKECSIGELNEVREEWGSCVIDHMLD